MQNYGQLSYMLVGMLQFDWPEPMLHSEHSLEAQLYLPILHETTIMIGHCYSMTLNWVIVQH